MENNYGEQILSAVDILVKKRIEAVKYDASIICSIEDDINADAGEYVVNNGSASFTAYSSDESKYRNGEQVYVTIPQGDYNNKKFIIGKANQKNQQGINYTKPFDNVTFLDFIMAGGSTTIHANISAERRVPITTMTFNTIGYSKLGIKMNVAIGLNEGNTTGNYGIEMLINDQESIRFDSSQFLGNIYNFPISLTQEQVFEIQKDFKIETIKLFAYQDDNFNTTLYPLNVRPPYEDRAITFSNIQVLLGVDSSEANDGLTIMTNSSLEYVDDEQKYIRARLIKDHQIADIDSIEWYYYKGGAVAEDPVLGMSWVKLDVNDEAFFFNIDSSINYNRLRAIAITENKKYYSNILVFNRNELIDVLPTENSGNLFCTDGSNGNYFCYSAGNKLIDSKTATETKTLQFWMKDSVATLYESDKIIWYVPINSMLICKENSSINCILISTNEEDYAVNYKKYYTKNGDTFQPCAEGQEYDSTIQYYIKDPQFNRVVKQGSGRGVLAELQYSIGLNYYNNKNNIIKCEVYKDGLIYKASKKFDFGIMGTIGTELTLVLDQDHPLVPENEGITIVTPHLYGYENEEIELEETPVWSWYSSNAQAKELDIYEAKKYEHKENLIFNYIQVENLQENEFSQCKTKYFYVENNEYIQCAEDSTYDSQITYYIIASDTNVNACKIKIKSLEENIYNSVYILQCKYKNLIAYCPITIAADENYKIVGPDFITYDSEGRINFSSLEYGLLDMATTTQLYSYLDSDLYKIKYGDNSIHSTALKLAINTFLPTLENNRLKMPVIYSENSPTFSIQFVQTDGQIIFTQPVVVMQNRYPSSTLNQWNGKDIEITKDGKILTNVLAAGKKNADDNTFSGVVMGAWEEENAQNAITEQTGIYGFNRGAMSYAFKEDGTAFIGKSGGGRINFDGNDATIYSGNWDWKWEESERRLTPADKAEGMGIDLQGASLFTKLPSGYIKYIQAGVQGGESTFAKAQEEGTTLYIKKDNKYEAVSPSDEFNPKIDYYISNENNIIELQGNTNSFPLSIGKLSSGRDYRDFRVGWDGSVYCKTVYCSDLQASGGSIAYWDIYGYTIYATRTFNNESNKIELNCSNQQADFGINLYGSNARIKIYDKYGKNKKLYGSLGYGSSSATQQNVALLSENENVECIVSNASAGLKLIEENYYISVSPTDSIVLQAGNNGGKFNVWGDGRVSVTTHQGKAFIYNESEVLTKNNIKQVTGSIGMSVSGGGYITLNDGVSIGLASGGVINITSGGTYIGDDILINSKGLTISGYVTSSAFDALVARVEALEKKE